MKHTTAFDKWFADYLEQDQFQVQRLLRNGMATRFLIAWSLFESKCFNGFMKIDRLLDFAKEISADQDFNSDKFKAAGRHFHNRYQDRDHLRHLLHDQKIEGLSEILGKNFEELSNYELVFMLLVVVYRFRNNIFHGNKGVESWLQYEEQIHLCIDVMQKLILVREATYNNGLQASAYRGA